MQVIQKLVADSMSTDKNPNVHHTTNSDNFERVNSVHTRPASQDEVAYRDGYAQGRNVEKSNQYQRERAAENNGLSSGIIIGGILALSAALGTAAWVYSNRNEPGTVEQPRVTQPRATSASPSPSPAAPSKQTTVIERTVEKVVPAQPPEVKVIEVPVPVMPATSTSTAQPNSEKPNANDSATSGSNTNPSGNSDSNLNKPQ